MHNKERYIAECIQSLLKQTYDNIEIIVVDDCSTDSSAAIVREFDDPRITLLRNDQNRGLTRSLNRALSVATGTYIARQDADDLSDPKRFERQVQYLERHDDVALVGTGAHLIDEHGDIFQKRVVLENVTRDRLLEKNHIIHGSILGRKRVFEEIDGYDELFRYSQDLDLWLRMSKQYTIRNISEPLYKFRIHDESVYFASKKESMLFAQLALGKAKGEVSETTLQDIRENGINTYYSYLTETQRRIFHESLAERYLRYGHIIEAREQCRRVFDIEPWSLKITILYILSFFGKTPINVVHKVVRRVLNVRIDVQNRIFHHNKTSL